HCSFIRAGRTNFWHSPCCAPGGLRVGRADQWNWQLSTTMTWLPFATSTAAVQSGVWLSFAVGVPVQSFDASALKMLPIADIGPVGLDGRQTPAPVLPKM